MRGLETRIAYANAKVLATIDPAEGGDALVFACQDAKCEGMVDYRNGCHDVPALFRDEADLTEWWEDGQELAAVLAEMADCTGCNDPFLPLCPTHG